MIDSTDLLHPSPAPHFETFQAFLICWMHSSNKSLVTEIGQKAQKIFAQSLEGKMK